MYIHIYIWSFVNRGTRGTLATLEVSDEGETQTHGETHRQEVSLHEGESETQTHGETRRLEVSLDEGETHIQWASA